jgi:hypothetical protein
MQAVELVRCCSAKWLYQLPSKGYTPSGNIESDDAFEKRATKEIKTGLKEAQAMDHRQQAFIMLAAAERQLTAPLKAAIEAAGFKNIAAANGTHGTPVYLYAYMQDEVAKKKKTVW